MSLMTLVMSVFSVPIPPIANVSDAPYNKCMMTLVTSVFVVPMTHVSDAPYNKCIWGPPPPFLNIAYDPL